MSETPVMIVAIGASAGGLEALQKLVSAIPAGSGLCYVIVQHLAPDHPSIMDQLLGAHSAIEVLKIEDGMRAQADTVFVIPAGPALTITDGVFRLHDDRKVKGVRTPIDRFFASVAEEAGRNAFCVVLSGTGSDGTAGLRAVKAAGGIAIVQESDTARFPGMPDSAVSTGLVDFVLPAERIPDRLIEIADHRARLGDSGLQQRLHEELSERLPEITALLRDVSGQDFTTYKPGTLLRRIERRMVLMRQRSVDGLIRELADNAEERDRLVQDFLIGVTRFFRDTEAFEVLRKEALEELFSRDPDKIRIWVPGCSTGEETYSIAMMVLDAIAEKDLRIPVQVFGTDIDGGALLHARQGLYSAQSAANIPEDKLERHFVAENGSFRASGELREICVFAPHNLLSDPPFSRLDLVSCRNLLIYLQAEGQNMILPRFHYALNQKAYLFLGPSESLGQQEDLFDTVSKTHRLFRRNDTAENRYTTLAGQKSRPKQQATRTPSVSSSRVKKQETPTPSIDALAEARFLSLYAAPFAVINNSNSVVYLSEQMARFVKPSKGAPTAELDFYLARDLRVPVRAAITAVRENGAPAETRNVVLEDGGKQRLFDIMASPMDDSGNVLIVLDEPRQPDTEVLKAAAKGQQYPGRETVEHELFSTRQQLESTLNEYETSSQELRTTNEELLSMNEELQSTNEELETSREELQSINEELETVNAELNENNAQLRRANSDIKNLFESTEVATLFLDSQLCVRGHTPRTTELFGIRERDTGRPFAELLQRFELDTLMEDIEEVGETLTILEREVAIPRTNQAFILRVRPYRTVDNRIDGYVLTFFDISERKQNEATLAKNARELERQYSELETLYDTTPVGLALVDREYRWIRINAELAQINGFPIEEHIGKRQEELIPDVHGQTRKIQEHVFKTGEARMGIEVIGFTPGDPDTERTWIADYYPVKSGNDVFAVGACVRDVTEERNLRRELALNLDRVAESEQRKSLLLAELQHRVKNTLASIAAITRFVGRSAVSVHDMQTKLINRLEAMSRTHDLLTNGEWSELSMRQLLRSEFAPFSDTADQKVSISGGDLVLNPEEALAVGLALHELVSNSVKHGALANDDGEVKILIEQGTKTTRATFNWLETGSFNGPEKNGRTGFGRFLLETAIEKQLNGTTSLEIGDGRVEFMLSFPGGTQ